MIISWHEFVILKELNNFQYRRLSNVIEKWNENKEEFFKCPDYVRAARQMIIAMKMNLIMTEFFFIMNNDINTLILCFIDIARHKHLRFETIPKKMTWQKSLTLWDHNIIVDTSCVYSRKWGMYQFAATQYTSHVISSSHWLSSKPLI